MFWFDHVTVKTIQKNPEPTGLNSYTVYLAKNEVENCQLVLKSSETVKNVTVEVSDFVNTNGAVLKSELFYAAYIGINASRPEKMTYVPDPFVPYMGAMSLEANLAQGYYIQLNPTKTRLQATIVRKCSLSLTAR